MTRLISTLLALTLAMPACAQPLSAGARSMTATPSLNDIRAVSPSLEHYTDARLTSEVWRRPDLSARDRSLATVATVIARGQTVEMPAQFALALDNGVTPAELSEVITHLAFYSGWPNAIAAVPPAKALFNARGVTAADLPPVHPKPLAIDEAAEKQRATGVQANVGPVSQGLVDYTTDLLFKDLRLRPGLAPRDRSLVTVSALISSGQVAQTTFHLNRAMDNGLTRRQVSELLVHLAFYAGWPNVMSAVPVVKAVLDARPAA